MEINEIVITVIGITIGIVLIATVLIPVSMEYITELSADTNTAVYGTLLGVVLIVTIMGMILVAIYGFLTR